MAEKGEEECNLDRLHAATVGLDHLACLTMMQLYKHVMTTLHELDASTCGS